MILGLVYADCGLSYNYIEDLLLQLTVQYWEYKGHWRPVYLQWKQKSIFPFSRVFWPLRVKTQTPKGELSSLRFQAEVRSKKKTQDFGCCNCLLIIPVIERKQRDYDKREREKRVPFQNLFQHLTRFPLLIFVILTSAVFTLVKTMRILIFWNVLLH